MLAERGGDDDDAVAAAAELGHQTGRQVGLVVGVGPDAEQGAAAHDTPPPVSRAARVSTSSAIGGAELQQQLRDLGVVPLLAGDAVDDVEQRDAEPVARRLVVLERVVERRRVVAEPVDDGAGEQLGVAERVGEPVRADRVLEVAGVADERPAGTVGTADVAGWPPQVRAPRGGDRRGRSRSASSGAPSATTSRMSATPPRPMRSGEAPTNTHA